MSNFSATGLPFNSHPIRPISDYDSKNPKEEQAKASLASSTLSTTLASNMNLEGLLFPGLKIKGVVEIIHHYSTLFEGLRTGITETELHRAAKLGDYETCKKIVRPEFCNNTTDFPERIAKLPAILAAVNQQGETAQHIAAKYGHVEVFDLLLNRAVGFKEDNKAHKTWPDLRIFRDLKGNTPLHIAIMYGNSAIYKKLIDVLANIAPANNDKKNALHFAAEKGQKEAVELILKKDPSLHDCIDKAGNKPFRTAARALAISQIGWEMLSPECRCKLQAGAAKHQNECQVSLRAKLSDQYKEICRLFWNNLAPLAKEGNRPNIIRIAHQQGHMPEVNWFVDKDDDKWIDSTKYEECIDKLIEICRAHVHDLQLLEEALKAKSVRIILDDYGRNALHLAAADGNTAKVKELVAYEQSLNADYKKQLIDHNYSIQKNNVLLMDKLLERPDSEGYTPLDYAALFGRVATFKYLEEQDKSLFRAHSRLKLQKDKFKFQEKDYDRILCGRFTALAIAAWQGHTDLVKLLANRAARLREFKVEFEYEIPGNFEYEIQRDNVKKVADCDAPAARTPLMFAALHSHITTCNALLDAGADAQAVDRNGLNALHYAVLTGQTVLIGSFLDRFPNLMESKTNMGQTPLHLAILENQIAACELLIKKGADPAAADKNGKTCFSYAEDSNNEQIKKLLSLKKSAT